MTDEQIDAIKEASLSLITFGGHEGMTPERVLSVLDFARAIERAAVAAERERCATLCEGDPYEIGSALAGEIRAG